MNGFRRYTVFRRENWYDFSSRLDVRVEKKFRYDSQIMVWAACQRTLEKQSGKGLEDQGKDELRFGSAELESV